MADEKKVRSFEDLIGEEGLLPLDRTVDLVTQIGGAIAVAEAAGVLIDCFEPRAILVVDDLPSTGAGAARTKVLGFARAADLPVRPGGARANYLAPEQLVQNEEPAARSPAALQFSLAAIAYEMLAGCPAFPEEIGEAAAADNGARVGARPPPPPVSELVMGVSSGLDQVLRRALSTLPNQRYERIDDFVSALREVADPGAVWDDGATVIWSPAAGDMEPAAPAFARTLAPPPVQPPAPGPTRSARLAGAARRVRSSVRSSVRASAGALVDRYRAEARELPPRGVGPAPRSSMPQMDVSGALPAGSAQGMAFAAFPATAMPSRRTQMSFLVAAVALVLGAVGVMSGSRVKTPVDNSQTESAVFVPESIRPRPRIEPLPSSPSPRAAAARSSAPAPASASVVASQVPRQPARPGRAHSRHSGAHRTGPARR